MNQNTVIGFVGVFGVWFTAGLALPLVNRLRALSPEQLMLSRGVVTAVLAMMLLRGNVWDRVDRWSILLGVCFALASLGLYRGIRTWGASPTITVVTLTPVMNFLFAIAKGKPVPLAALLSLILILLGVLLALRSKDKLSDAKAGLAWTLFGVVMNGLFYEFASTTATPPLQACFWQATWLAVIGGLGSLRVSWAWWWGSFQLKLVVVGFALVGGFLYFLANLIAFTNLSQIVAAVLVQGETPAVILMASILLGERLSRLQWLGVVIALLGAGYLSYCQL